MFKNKHKKKNAKSYFAHITVQQNQAIFSDMVKNYFYTLILWWRIRKKQRKNSVKSRFSGKRARKARKRRF